MLINIGIKANKIQKAFLYISSYAQTYPHFVDNCEDVNKESTTNTIVSKK